MTQRALTILLQKIRDQSVSPLPVQTKRGSGRTRLSVEGRLLRTASGPAAVAWRRVGDHRETARCEETGAAAAGRADGELLTAKDQTRTDEREHWGALSPS